MFCPECGKENGDNARFCSGCGAKLAEDESGREEPAPGGAGGPGKRTAVIVAAVTAGVAVFVLLILLAGFLAVPAFKGDAGGNLSGNNAAFKAGYMDIVKANQSRGLYLSADSKYSGSRMIEHDSYYEVTNCNISTDTHYDLGIMAGKKAGDTLQLDDTVYRITGISPWASGEGEYIGLEYVSGVSEDGGGTLDRDYNWNYYILIDEDDNAEKDTIYTGSVYFSKDCQVEAFDPNNEFGKHTVNIKDYLTKDNQKVGAQHGCTSYDGLTLWGDFDIDSSGLITSYQEYFVS